MSLLSESRDRALPRRLRFGIVCQGTTLRAWEAECVSALIELPGVEPALVIVDPRARAARPRPPRGLLGSLFRAVADRPTGALRRIGLDSLLPRVPRLASPASPGGGNRGPVDTPDRAGIARHDLDFVLVFAPGDVDRGILELPRHGAWAFRHGASTGAPGFLEILDRDPVTEVALVNLTPGDGADVLLRRGFVPTYDTSYRLNRDRIVRDGVLWPAQVCLDLLEGREPAPPSGAAAASAAPVGSPPGSLETLAFLVRLAGNVVRRLWKAVARTDRWHVGWVERPIAEVLERGLPERAEWLPPPAAGRYLADPFGRWIDGRLHVLFEEYDFRTLRGRIAHAVVGGDSTETGRPAFAAPHHLSYPFLLERGGEVYCAPESHEARRVDLFRLDDFPSGWRRVATLLEGVAAVDATIFPHDDLWWILATDRDDGPDHKLLAWYADDLLGPYRPHRGNPVKLDPRSARPAGTPFVHAGTLYRPAQDCSSSYGRQVVVNRVVRLGPTEFEEEAVRVVEPPAGRWPDGLHTLSAAGPWTLIDARRTESSLLRPVLLAHNLRALARTVRERLRPRST